MPAKYWHNSHNLSKAFISLLLSKEIKIMNEEKNEKEKKYEKALRLPTSAHRWRDDFKIFFKFLDLFRIKVVLLTNYIFEQC